MEPLKEQDPKQLGDWRIMGRLGEGGFGTVFLAERGAQKAAIKVIRDDPDALSEGTDRFELEITALKKLVDPYIARIIDSKLEGEVPWFATEFVNGPTLEAKVKYEGVLEERTWFNLAANLFHALNTSHNAGVVHKDIKPSNIILGETGNKLIDFGIAHISGHTRKVNFGDFEGSRPYSSPESSTGNSVPGMDVFSAAVTLAYAGLGRSIWKGENEVQLMRSINESEPDLVGLTHLQTTFLKPLLNKNVSDRPSAEDAYRTSLEILTNLDTGTKRINLQRWERAAKSTNTRKLTKSTSVLVSVLLVAGGLGTYKVLNSSGPSNPSSALVTSAPTASPSSSLGDTSPTSKEIQANLDLAKKYYEQKNYEKAMVYAKLAANAGNAHGMYDVGFLLEEMGEQEKAIPWYVKAAQLNYGDAFVNLGNLYFDLNNTDSALSWLEEGASRNNVKALNNLGLYYAKKGQNAKALTYYLKSAKFDDVLGMANAGAMYERLNEIEKAKKWWLKAISLGSNDAANYLGFYYESNTDWNNAKKYYQIAADRKDPTGMYNLAIVLGNHYGQGDQGCLILKEVIAIKGVSPDLKAEALSAIKEGCSATKTSESPKPVASSAGTLSESPAISSTAKYSSIFGRPFFSGMDWLIPLTNSKSEVVPAITNVQFTLIGASKKVWFDIGYKLKKSEYGVQAQVDALFLEALFKRNICPQFRFVRIENGKVEYIWEKSDPECATDYVP